MQPRILIASLTNHSMDGRVARQIGLLSHEFTVISAGTGPPRNASLRTIELSEPAIEKRRGERVANAALMLTRRYEKLYWSRPWVQIAVERLQRESFDLLLVNDLPLLPAALRAAGSRPVIFDAHEFYPRQREGLRFRFFTAPYLYALCRRYIPQAAATLTVSDGLVAEYEKTCGVTPALVRNTPPTHDLQPSPTGKTIDLVYHGRAHARRRLGDVIEAVLKAEPRFRLHMILRTKDRILNELKQLAVGSDRIVFHPTLPNEEICNAINRFDVGISFFQPTTFNLLHCLPNKFFESIQARLGLIVSPSPHMAAIVERESCGIVTDDFTPEALTRAINKLTPKKVGEFKSQSHRIAAQYCWEVDSKVLLSTVERVLGTETAGDHHPVEML